MWIQSKIFWQIPFSFHRIVMHISKLLLNKSGLVTQFCIKAFFKHSVNLPSCFVVCLLHGAAFAAKPLRLALPGV